MNRNELEKRLEKESVYDTLMDVYSQLNLDVKGNDAIHDLNCSRNGITMTSSLMSRILLSKDASFSDLKLRHKNYYPDVLDVITKVLKDYPVRI